MQRIKALLTAIVLPATLLLAANADATVTTTRLTAPADGALLFQNLDTNPAQTVTVSGTTDGTTGDLVDIGCYSGGTDYQDYTGNNGSGIAVNSDGSFSVAVPYSFFAGSSCNLVAVPHGTSVNTLPSGDAGVRVAFSEFQTSPGPSGPGPTYDYSFDDATLTGITATASIDDCGPATNVLDGTSAMNSGTELFFCAGDLYNSPADFYGGDDLTRSEIEVDGTTAYGPDSAYNVAGSTALPGFPALSATVERFDSTTGDAQTSETDPLVKCAPDDSYDPSQCTSFVTAGVKLTRVTGYTEGARVATVTDVYSSTDLKAHALKLEYETDLGGTTAGWELPGQTSFSQESTGDSRPGPSSAAAAVYAIHDTGAAPSLNNLVGVMTFSAPYNGVTFDTTLSTDGPSGLFGYDVMVPAGGSTLITWSYATGASLAEVQGDAAAAPGAMRRNEDAAQPPTIAIAYPTGDATSPAKVGGTASAGSGVRSVTVNGVPATVSGHDWTAAVPLSSVDARNTLTATVTSQAGNTATATRNVAYTPQSKVRLDHWSVRGRAVLVTLTCEAVGGNCRGSVRLHHIETVVEHHKNHTRAVAVASRTRYVLSSGQTGTIRAVLDRTGRRLLALDGRLSIRGRVTVTQRGGFTESVARFKVTVTQPRRKHRK